MRLSRPKEAKVAPDHRSDPDDTTDVGYRSPPGGRTEHRSDVTGPAGHPDYPPEHEPEATVVDRRPALAREKDQFGGVKIGSAFFGWLTATGMAVLLTAALTAAGTAIGLGVLADVDDAARSAGNNETVGLAGGIALLVILFLAYVCGGYVAGRMARFNGLRQGVAVWLWGLLMAVVVAVIAAVAGDKYDVLARVNVFPRLPLNEGDLTTAGIVTAAVVVGAALVGALIGGLAGMRFHRRVDRAGLRYADPTDLADR